MFSWFKKSSAVEYANGNGNCAFNAFALGLCRPAVLNALLLRDDNPFVVKTAEALRVRPATWQALKTRLLIMSRSNLQDKLAPILRHLAIHRIIDDRAQTAAHLQTTSQALLTEYEQYAIQRTTKQAGHVSLGAVGDIFFRHPFIVKQFEELLLSHRALDEAQVELGRWWTATGHQLFLQRMAHSATSAADTDLYAGDLELAQLGAFFGVNVRVHSQSRHFNAEIHRANGQMPAALAAVARTLANRGVIYNDTFCWTDLTRDELQARLGAVPDYVALADYIAHHAPIVPGNAVPADWSPACVAALRARGVIQVTDDVFSVRLDEAFLQERLSALATHADVVQAWESTYRIAPVIMMENESASHWNVIINAAAVLKNKGKRSREASSTATLQDSNKNPHLASSEPMQGEKEVNDAVMKHLIC